MRLPAPPLPRALRRPPRRPGERAPDKPLEQLKEAGDQRGGLGRRAHVALGRRALGACSARRPTATTGSTRSGSATLFAFLSQAVTGVFLAMYYDPSVTNAYESTRHITNEVFLGEFVRGMHKWGSTVMMVLIFLHMARTFFFGAYKYPRELTWIIGVVLLVLTRADVADGLPAAVRPALLLGDGRRREHQRHRADRRAVPGRLPARRRRVRRDDALALLRHPHAAHARRDRRADRRAPLPRDAPRHDGAAWIRAEQCATTSGSSPAPS